MCLNLVFFKQIKSFEEEEVIDKITISPGGGGILLSKIINNFERWYFYPEIEKEGWWRYN